MSKATAARTRAWGFRRGEPLRRGAPFRMERTSPRNNAIQCEQLPMYDMNNIKKLARIAPDAMRGFEAFDAAALKKGAIPRKYKELMALAIALTTQCPYCLEIHKGAAINAGATKEELAETIAWTLRAGAAITHGTHLMGES